MSTIWARHECVVHLQPFAASSHFPLAIESLESIGFPFFAGTKFNDFDDSIICNRNKRMDKQQHQTQWRKKSNSRVQFYCIFPLFHCFAFLFSAFVIKILFIRRKNKLIFETECEKCKLNASIVENNNTGAAKTRTIQVDNSTVALVPSSWSLQHRWCWWHEQQKKKHF